MPGQVSTPWLIFLFLLLFLEMLVSLSVMFHSCAVMANQIKKGTWVQVHYIVLSQSERAPQVPPDTQQVPLEMTVKGFLVEPACLGEEVEILTQVGRRVRGTPSRFIHIWKVSRREM